MYDVDEYERKLATSIPLRETVLRDAFRALGLPKGSQGLDVGCGLGHLDGWLAELIGPTGTVTGVDVQPAFIERAGERARGRGCKTGCVSAKATRGPSPFGDDHFDWALSVDCVGYPADADPLALVRELARVVRPGGPIALLAWTSQRLLPGHAQLEAGVSAVADGSLPYTRAQPPTNHFERALGWYRTLGLVEARGRPFTGSVQAPLDEALREALADMFDMLWGDSRDNMPPELRSEYERLCTPGAPGFILDESAYHGQFTYTMFSARVKRQLR